MTTQLPDPSDRCGHCGVNPRVEQLLVCGYCFDLRLQVVYDEMREHPDTHLTCGICKVAADTILIGGGSEVPVCEACDAAICDD